MIEGVGVIVGVGVIEGVRVAVEVLLGVWVADAVGVTVGVAVSVGVPVAEGVEVDVGVWLGGGVFVAVGLFVGVGVADGIRVWVAVGEGEGVAVAVGVGDEVGVPVAVAVGSGPSDSRAARRSRACCAGPLRRPTSTIAHASPSPNATWRVVRVWLVRERSSSVAKPSSISSHVLFWRKPTGEVCAPDSVCRSRTRPASPEALTNRIAARPAARVGASTAWS